nr:Protein of unknown function (DUF3154) [uncultured Mediterranean phage uvMED]BAR29293.1 Protein of unknown function (DUF3154) [uncultured Mediterranean phage uvMED]BAR29350.1 Protein of unknown function (DUF3154) [uncultured Mediterranean phage uvMED]BAR29376.1 Protein of unknown function (DUF3154) [uncultured Mediterranean phage uvMED]
MLEKLIDPISNILDKFVADKDLKQKLEHELKTELHRANMAQIEVNKEEAKHRTVFVAGWRPFTGWVCATALAYHFIVEPVLVFFLSWYGIQIELPQFDMGSLLTVLMGMLGLGGLRTYEKKQGLTK